MAPYNTYQLSQVIATLALRLYDPTNQFWPQSELTLYINEALQTWNALTSFWRGDFTFQTAQNQTWYDLTAQANSLRPLTTTIPSLYPIINTHLLEPAATGPVSKQFSQTAYLNALLQCENEMLSECGVYITRTLVPAVSGRIVLADGTFDVIRIAYLPSTSVIGGYGSGSFGLGPYGISGLTGTPENTVLWRDDAWAEQSFNPLYTLNPPGTPTVYLMSAQPPISFDVDTPPGFGGVYEVLTTNQALATGTQLMSIPNDWTHVAKWGALAYLLAAESNAKDLPRAAYCAKRFVLGKQLLQSAAALLAMRIDNVPLEVDAVTNGDQYDTRWQAHATNPPRRAYQAGLNLVALAPAPWNPYSVTATVVQNAPLPSGPSDYVQLSQDVLDVLIDYAQHLAAFKMGGAEFASTMPMLDRFMREAMVYNSKLSEMGEYTAFLLGLSNRNEAAAPRLDPEVLA